MDGTAAVPEGVLREPLGIAAFLGPLRPRMPVTMQADPDHPRNPAAAAKFCGAGIGSRRPDGGEQRPEFGPGFQDFPQPFANGQAGRFAVLAELFAAINEQPVLPVDFFSLQFRRVGLRRAGFVKELVIGPLFRVSLARDDLRVFFRRDGPLAFAAHLGPGPFRQDRPRQPANINGKVVQAAQVMREGVGVLVELREQFFRRGLYEGTLAQGIELMGIHRPLAPGAGGFDTVRAHFRHDLGPGPRIHFRVGGSKIGSGNRQIDRRLAVGFVFAVKELFRDLLVASLQAALLGRIIVVLPVIDSVVSAVESVSVEHGISPVVGDTTAQIFPLPSSRRADPSWHEF